VSNSLDISDSLPSQMQTRQKPREVKKLRLNISNQDQMKNKFLDRIQSGRVERGVRLNSEGEEPCQTNITFGLVDDDVTID